MSTVRAVRMPTPNDISPFSSRSRATLRTCITHPPRFVSGGPSSRGPAQDRRGDLVGLVELGEMAGAGDRGDLGAAGNRGRKPVGVAARHDAVLFAPDQQGWRRDQWQTLFQAGVAERPESARRGLVGTGL